MTVGSREEELDWRGVKRAKEESEVEVVSQKWGAQKTRHRFGGKMIRSALDMLSDS